MSLSAQVFAAILIAATLAAMPFRATAEPPPRNILIIDESAAESPFGRRFGGQIHATLDAKIVQAYAIYAEYLDFGHFTESNYDLILETYFTNKYRDKPISLIIALGSEALNFSLHLRSKVWSDAPIVFVSFDDAAAKDFTAPPNATGIIAARPFQDMVEAAKILVPGLARIALVGASLEREPLRGRYRQDVQQLAKALDVVNLSNLSLDQVRMQITALHDDTAIVYTPIYRDGTGTTHNPVEALKAVAGAANRPIVVDSEDFIGMGATGGFVMSAEKVGREAGQRVARILNGESAANIPVVTTNFNTPVFDARKLKQWSISESSLPAGSVVLFRQLNAWDLYHWQIVTIFTIIPLQSLIIWWLYYEHRRRRAAERESRQHLLEVAKMDRAMTVSAMSASIAHELNQPLGAILNNAEAAEMLLCANSPDLYQLKEILADIRRDDSRAAEIIKRLRALLKHADLEAKDIDLAGVVSDTVRLIEHQAAERGVILKVRSVPDNLWVRADRVHIQQVILNVALNAIDAMQSLPLGARKLEFYVNRHNGNITVSIKDTGTGIPEDKLDSIFEPFVTTKKQGTGIGLSIARTIVNTYGGKIWAENEAGGGAIFHFTLHSVRTEAEVI
jgi:signal transduction histidine kinase